MPSSSQPGAAIPTQADIADYLKRELRADAAIVVGSRADGTARPDSDWDCYVLVDDGTGPRGPLPEPRRLDGAELDVGIVHLPLGNDDVLGTFGPNLQQARVLFDTRDRAAQSIIAYAAAHYSKGRSLTDHERSTRARQMARNISTMIARRDQPGAFFEALTFVFYTAHRNWYEIIHRRYSQSVHRALPEIQARDPQFHRCLMVLMSSEAEEAKIDAARDLYSKLFE